MQSISTVLYEYLQSVQSYIAPPITAIFLLGIFSKRINSRGAMAALASGIVIATIRIILELTKDSFAAGSFLHTLGDTNFLVFSTWFFVFSVLTTIGVSLLTPAQDEKDIQGLTLDTVTEEQKILNRQSFNMWDVAASLFVVAMVAYVMFYFS